MTSDSMRASAENHRAADLVGGAGVAGDAVEGGGGSLALTERAAEGGEAETERRGDGDQAGVVGDEHLLRSLPCANAVPAKSMTTRKLRNEVTFLIVRLAI